VTYAELCPKAPLKTADAALVVDVIRATTTALAFFEAGAREVWFAPDHDAARSLKPEGFLVAGETRGEKPPGFDLGNSPREALAAPVRGRRVVMSTTNGTRAAYRAAEAAPRVALAALWNLDAAAGWAGRHPRVLLVAAGKEGGLGLDDAYVLGALLERLGDPEGDGARVAEAIFARYPTPQEALSASAAAKALRAVGLLEDVAAASKLNQSKIVPELAGREGPYLVFRRSGS